MTLITTPARLRAILRAMVGLPWQASSLVLALFPAAYGLWVGRRLVRRLDDPAFPELHSAHYQRFAAVFAVCGVSSVVVHPDLAAVNIALTILGGLAARHAVRRAMFNERWGLLRYMSFTLRFAVGVLGAVLILALLPSLLRLAGAAAVFVGIGLGAAVLGWAHFGGRILAWLIRAEPLEDAALTARFADVLTRADCPAPRLLHAAAPGGYWVNAFALPSSSRPGVLLTDDLLVALTPSETTAIFAHEIAHLEHFARRRLIVRQVALLMLVTIVLVFLLWLGPDSPALAIASWAWPLACLVALTVVAARNQAHEHESDIRALELVGDPDVLISALTKIHNLMRLPRRWGTRAEQHQTHPSLAKRVRAIRDAAATRGFQVAGVPFSEIAVRSADDASEVVVFAADRLHWLHGMDPDHVLDPRTAWHHAKDSRSIRYRELDDLRLEVGKGKQPLLVATDSRGHKMRLPLAAESVATVKSNLERVDLEVRETAITPADRTRHAGRDLKSRFWAAVALFTALLPPQSLPLFLISGLVLLRPARVPLVAGGAIAISTALLGFRASQLLFFELYVAVLLAALKAILGVTLLADAFARTRKPGDTVERGWLITVGGLAALGALYAWQGVGRFGMPLPRMELHLWARYDFGLAAVLVGLTVALWSHGGRRMRVPALAALVGAGILLATSTTWFRDQFGDDPLAASTAALSVDTLHLDLWRDHVVPHLVGDLRLSPSGKRFAARLTTTGYSGEEVAGREQNFTVEQERGEFTRFRAWDLQFVEDDLVALVVELDDDLVLQRVRVWPDRGVVQEIQLPRLASPTLRVDPTRKRWEITSTDFSRSESILLRGDFRSDEFVETRWKFEAPDGLFLHELKANAGTRALLLTSRFDFAESDHFPLFLMPLASYSTLSEIAVLGATERVALARTTLQLWCAEPQAEQRSFTCGGNDRESKTRIWTVDAERQSLTPVGMLAGYYYRGRLVRDDELLLEGSSAELVVVHLPTRRAFALKLPRGVADTSAIQAALGGTASNGQRDRLLADFPSVATHRAAAKERAAIALAAFEGPSSRVTVYRIRDVYTTRHAEPTSPTSDSKQTSSFLRVWRRR